MKFTALRRGATSLSLFALFGLGSLLLSPIMFVLRRPELCQPIVRTIWRFLLWLFEVSGLIRVEGKDLPHPAGTVIVANHPSLIDVIVFTVKFPKTLYVAKHALRSNLFMGAIVRATSLPDDERLPESAQPYLAKGWNVLIFPEGTRSPRAGGLHPFRRGAAQVALRSNSPILPVGLHLSRRILAGGQAAGDMGEECVVYRLKCDAVHHPVLAEGEKLRSAARSLTQWMRTRIEAMLV